MDGIDAAEVVVKIVSSLYYGVSIDYHNISHVLIIEISHRVLKGDFLPVQPVLAF